MKIGIVVHPNISEASIVKRLHQIENITVTRLEHSEMTAELGIWNVDLMVSIGGDGTFLTTARIAATINRPMIGVRVPASVQSKPFLPDISLDNLHDFLGELANGMVDRLKIDILHEGRHFLKGRVYRNGTQLGVAMNAINEISIGKSSLKGTVTVQVDVALRVSPLIQQNVADQVRLWQQVLKVRADLTMVSTATGSTGYSMSAGGPLIHPEDASVVCAHVAPIGFGQRPLVLPGKYDVRMKLLRADSAAVTFDCQNEIELQPGDEVIIERGNTYTVLRDPNWSFFDRARDVLNWAG